MSVQAAVQATLAYKVEGSFGAQPSASGAQLLRRVSSSLAPVKDTFSSNEVRSDFQVNDMRHGLRSVRGSIEGELSTATYDDLFEAAMRGTWANGGTVAPAQFLTGVTIANGGTAGTSTLTFAGAGSLLTQGFKIGDVVRGTGFTNPANSGINLRIVALSATVMTVTPRLVATAQQASGWAVAAAGKKLLMGTTKRSFSFEQSLADAQSFEMYNGVRINGFSVNAPANGMATCSFDLIGQNPQVPAGSAFFTTPTTETVTGLLSGVDGAIRLNGEEQTVITGLQFSLTNNVSMQPVIGSTLAPDLFYGRMVINGSVTAFIEDPDLATQFLNEGEMDLVAVLEASGADPQDFLAFNMQRIKFTSAQKTIGPDGGIICQFGFQALRRDAGGNLRDAGTLIIQRSN